MFLHLSVCLHGLGVEDGNITNNQLSASSSVNSFTPDKARLNGDSCWMPSGAGTPSPSPDVPTKLLHVITQHICFHA